MKVTNSTNKALLVAGLSAVAMGSAFAEVEESAAFGTLLETFTVWFTHNLGKLLALIGFAGTFIVYMMTHKGGVLFVGVIISLIAGGLVGISETFFNAGANSFGTTE